MALVIVTRYTPRLFLFPITPRESQK